MFNALQYHAVFILCDAVYFACILPWIVLQRMGNNYHALVFEGRSNYHTADV